MTESEKLIFTSEHALRRSIRKVYPKLTGDQQEETFEQMKSCIGARRLSNGDWLINGKINDKTGWSDAK